VFRDQLRLHLAAEAAAIWPPARVKLTSDPHGQALLDPMEDEQQLIGPLQAVIDDAFTMNADPVRLRRLLTRLRARLTSHLAHEEADALALIGQIMSPSELGAIARAIRVLPRMMPILIIVTGTPRRTPGCTGPGSQVPGIFGVAMVTVFLTPRTCSRPAGAPG
jgi:hypothetical protein